MRRTAVGVILAASALTLAALHATTLAQSATGVVISEVAYNLGDDWIELYNRGPEAVQLDGWTLSVDSSYAHPQALTGSIGAGEFLVLVPTYGLLDSGDYVRLQMPNGLSDAVSFGDRTVICSGLTAASGQSLHLMDLTAAAGSCGYVAGAPSPGGPPPAPTPTPTATDTPTATPTATATVSPGSVALTEVYYQGACELEWVEIANVAAVPVAMDGWRLRDNNGYHSLALSLAPGEVVVVQGGAGAIVPECGATTARADGSCMGIKLADEGDAVELVDGNGRVLASLVYGGASTPGAVPLAPAGHSLARLRLPDGSLMPWMASTPVPGCLQLAPTPTATPTVTATPTLIPTPTATVAPGSVALTEVFYQGNCDREWVEIANLSRAEIVLDGWRLTDNGGSTSLRLTLSPGEVVLIQPSGSQVTPGCAGRGYLTQGACLGNGLADDGDRVELTDATGRMLDSVYYGPATTPGAVPLAPAGLSLARPREADGTLDGWQALAPDPGCLQGASSPTAPGPEPSATLTPEPPPDATPTAIPPREQVVHLAYLPLASCRAAAAPLASLLISEVLYQGITADEGDEFVELRGFTGLPLDLTGHKLGDAEYAGDGEGMYLFPGGTFLPAGGTLVVARCANSFAARFGRPPDLEFAPGGCLDSPEVPNMQRYTAWGRGSFNLANSGDEVLLLGPDDAVLDAVAYGSGAFGLLGLVGEANAPAPLSLQRVGALDRDDMSLDFGHEGPSPGTGLDVPVAPLPAPGPSWAGLTAFWGNLHSHSSYSDGAGPPELAFARARQAGLNFYAVTDHGWMLRAVEWSRLRGVASDATVPGRFLALAGFEWTHRTEGHINVFGTTELASRDLPETSNVAGLLRWAEQQPGAVLQSNHPGLGGSHVGQEAVNGRVDRLHLQEVVSGRGTMARTYEEALLEAWRNGWQVAPTAGSDTDGWFWGSDTAARTGVWALELTEAAVLEALRHGRAFATEDANLAVAWRCGDDWMGASSLAAEGSCTAFYADGDGEPATLALLDLAGRTLASWGALSGEESPFSAPPEPGFWLRATQADGDRAWTPPIWAGE
ncbi:MAG: CehA/McbA family metallohydrolase [Anaerolineae bacterium]|nr:CehA/McbA family metallohydrolase [Anaerolineae bacterium]